jgi:hypothetical protein
MRKVSFLAFLGFILVATSACGWGAGSITTAPPNTVECLKEVVPAVIQVFTAQEAPSLLDLAQITLECTPVVVDLYQQLTLPDQTVLHVEATNITKSATVQSSAYPNCSFQPIQATYSYDLPVTLTIGSGIITSNYYEPFNVADRLHRDTLPPSPADTNSRLADAIYSQYNLAQWFNTPGQPSDQVTVTVPARSKISLSIPILLYYKQGYGVVRYHHQDSPTTRWAYDYQFSADHTQIAKSITPVTSLDCNS